MKIKYSLLAAFTLAISFGANAQHTNDDYIAELKTLGYNDIRTIPFSLTKGGYAGTVVAKSKSDKKKQYFFASIISKDDGTALAFKIAKPCTPDDSKAPLVERAIRVSGKKIATYRVCSGVPGKSETQEIYLLKTVAGSDFVKNEFQQNEIVFVHLDGLPVPFHTDGFSQALIEVGEPAL